MRWDAYQTREFCFALVPFVVEMHSGKFLLSGSGFEFLNRRQFYWNNNSPVIPTKLYLLCFACRIRINRMSVCMILTFHIWNSCVRFKSIYTENIYMNIVCNFFVFYLSSSRTLSKIWIFFVISSYFSSSSSWTLSKTWILFVIS